MANYLGKNWTRKELTAQVGHMRQIAGIRALEYADGREKSARVFHAYTGSGLAFDVLADRALDISRLSYKGMALNWASSVGDVHPAYYEPQGTGWLRSFPGGLVATCGLDQYGAPGEDSGESFGIHGRVGNLPAEQVAYRETWEGDEYHLEISGQMRQSRLFGENLLLQRRISTQLGSNKIQLEDTVTNEGFNIQPHMILYHCNLGFPLLDESAQLEVDAAETIARDEEAQKGLDQWAMFQVPTPDYAEQVFRHVVNPDADGLASVTLRNSSLGLALTIRYSAETLPHLFQWKMMGQGAYVLGIEPANCSVIQGREVARQKDVLPFLEPGEQRSYQLSFEVETIEG